MRQYLAVAIASIGCLTPLRAGGPGVAVQLRLTTAPDLPAVTREGLVDEATAIWARAGVRLDWESPDVGSTPAGLRVLVVHRPPPVATDETWPVGELVMARQGMPGSAPRQVPIAFVSIEAARQILGSAGIGAEPTRRTEQRLGIVVGRAVAHEIGHYLLNTPTHAASGLMRARIDAEVFADLRDGAFFLDRHAARWLASRGPTAMAGPVPPFSYVQH